MKLRYTPIKDYVHTVEAVVTHTGTKDKLELVPTVPFPWDEGLATDNPLNTVPAVQMPDGEPVIGGPVIYELLDTLHNGHKLFPQASDWEAVRVRRVLWMADGLFDAFVKVIIESWIPREDQRQDYIDRQVTKMNRVCDQLNKDVAWFADALDIGQVRAVGSLQFVDLKIADLGTKVGGLPSSWNWRDDRPELAAWFDATSPNPIFQTNLLPPPA